MEKNLEFVLKATKIIVESCVKAKFEFANKVKAYFQTHKIPNDPIVKLPKKRSAPENQKKKLVLTGNNKKKPKICTQEAFSSSESEIEYNNSSFSKISKISLVQFKTIEDEIKEVFSSDDCSLFNTDTEDDSMSEVNYVKNYESVFECLSKREGNGKVALKEFDRLLDSFELVEAGEMKVCQEIVWRILGLELKFNEFGADRLCSEVWKKGKQVMGKWAVESFGVGEDWGKLLKEINEAGRMDSKERVMDILLRVENGFPEMLDDKIYKDIKPLMKQVKVVAQTWMAGETKDSACRIMAKWNKMIQFLNNQQKAKMDEILTQFEFLENEKSLIQSWNQSVVIKNKNKRK